MKQGIKTLVEGLISTYDMAANIADQLIYELDYLWDGISFYLNDEELELYEKGINREELDKEVREFIRDNFDYVPIPVNVEETEDRIYVLSNVWCPPYVAESHLLSNGNFGISFIEDDQAVANHYGYKFCVIFEKL